MPKSHLKKRLILRLSSLGDVILATSALEVEGVGASVDWVTSQEYSSLLVQHPRLGKVWTLDRKVGLLGWIRLGRSLWVQGYDEIFDLHVNLRTRILHFLFFCWSLKARKSFHWRAVPKQRMRLYLYYLFKKNCPKSWRPTPWVVRYAQTLGGSGQERPQLKHLLQSSSLVHSAPSVSLPSSVLTSLPHFYGREKYICVMPGSRWSGKNWPVDYYAELLPQLPYLSVILGTEKDAASLLLVEKLQEKKVGFFSGVGLWDLKMNAKVLAGSIGYLGGDTGLAHLAEAVGIPVSMIFGPTAPAMGFGPWRSESQVLSSSLGCRPCGKDGRFCFRPSRKYLCLTGLSPQDVQETLDFS